MAYAKASVRVKTETLQRCREGSFKLSDTCTTTVDNVQVLRDVYVSSTPINVGDSIKSSGTYGRILINNTGSVAVSCTYYQGASPYTVSIASCKCFMISYSSLTTVPAISCTTSSYVDIVCWSVT